MSLNLEKRSWSIRVLSYVPAYDLPNKDHDKNSEVSKSICICSQKQSD